MPVQQFGELLGSPQKFKRHLLLVTLTALTLAALAAIFFDQQLSQFFDRPEIRESWRPAARIITDIGLSEYYFALAILTWAFAKWLAPKFSVFDKFRNKVDFYRRWGVNFLIALIVSGVFTHIIKFTVGRQRPHKTPTFEPFIFHPFNAHWHWQSFASGHSQVMFTVATMMSIAFPKLRWLWVMVAIVVCGTRIVVHDHFLSDTIFGACIGYVGTLVALKLMQRNNNNKLY